MKDAIQSFKAVSFETRKELDIHEKVALMNATLILKLNTERRLRDAAAEAYALARRSKDPFGTFKIDSRIRQLVEKEWSEKIDSEIMADRLWFDKTVMINIVNYALRQIGGVHVDGIDHFVVKGGNEIRIIAARPF